jgi:hypothetical protein
MRRCLVPPGSLAPQIQAFLLVNPVGSLVIVSPAFTPQQDVNARKTVTDASFGDLIDSCSDRPVVTRRSLQFEIKKRTGDQANTAGASDRDTVFVDQLFDELPPLPRP